MGSVVKDWLTTGTNGTVGRGRKLVNMARGTTGAEEEDKQEGGGRGGILGRRQRTKG